MLIDKHTYECLAYFVCGCWELQLKLTWMFRKITFFFFFNLPPVLGMEPRALGMVGSALPLSYIYSDPILSSSGWLWTQYIAQAGLKLEMLQPLSGKCWDCRTPFIFFSEAVTCYFIRSALLTAIPDLRVNFRVKLWCTEIASNALVIFHPVVFFFFLKEF
jgi:hypothetical protein